MIKAVIIDDEKLAREVIRSFLLQHDQVKIVAECENGFEGIKAIQQHQPGLIFLDIQMPKLSGFEMLELLNEQPVIIFSTAYDQYAIRAFELSAADYLLKPYSRERFTEALEKALWKIGAGAGQKEVTEKLLEQNRGQMEEINRIAVRVGDKIVIIPAGSIAYIEAQDDYVHIHADRKRYLKQMTMKYLEEVLPKDRFVRVHRSFIVNIDHLDRLEAYTKDSYMAILKDGGKLSVSRTGYVALKEMLRF